MEEETSPEACQDHSGLARTVVESRMSGGATCQGHSGLARTVVDSRMSGGRDKFSKMSGSQWISQDSSGGRISGGRDKSTNTS